VVWDVTAFIEVRDVNQRFDHAGLPRDVLTDISMSVEEGSFTAIIGPSGCGKTTLLNILAGLDQPVSGHVSIDGKPPKAGRDDIGFGPVRDCLLPWRRALDNAALALEVKKVPRKIRYERAQAALATMGLAGFEDMYPAQLSQGMRQRVALARLWAGDPRVLLLDEPFSALDAQTRIMVQDAFLEVWERHRVTVVLVTHDLAEAITLADRVVVLTRSPGRVRATYPISIPRPRHANEIRRLPEFHQTYDAIWQDLRDEVQELERAELEATLK
jgi:NitT/TauT family transport system ATP-binding protein